jgi:hypothetical protein
MDQLRLEIVKKIKLENGKVVPVVDETHNKFCAEVPQKDGKLKRVWVSKSTMKEG